MARWVIKNKKMDIEAISKAMGVNKVIATVMVNRGLYEPECINRFLHPNVRGLRDTLMFEDMKKAFDILVSAKESGRKIVVYGDYDVDGVTSTAILYKMLKEFGADVSYFIPNRVEDGYGLNINAVEKLRAMGCEVLFTCDNGIAAIEEVRLAKSYGMEVIILDHHEPLYENIDGVAVDILPEAEAIIDAKVKKCDYPFKLLCAGGLSFKFAKAFFEYVGIESTLLNEFIVLGGIATVCDIVDLQDENRIIAKNSINILNKFRGINVGLLKLIEVSGLMEKTISEYSYGFVIGPCINASGRLESAAEAVKLVTCDDEEEARRIAEKLFRLNIERKEMTENGTLQAMECVENTDVKNDKVLVIYIPEVHESIAGIVAGRIKERYYKPTIVITDGEEFAKGSARSIEGYDIFEQLQNNKDVLVKAGGHTMAAGLSIRKENIDLLRKRLNEDCALSDAELMPKVQIDMELAFESICLSLVEEIKGLMPFGKGNEEPIFATKDVLIKYINFVGANKNIIQLGLVDTDNIEIRGIIFSKYEKFIDVLGERCSKPEAERVLAGNLKDIFIKLDIVYRLDVNKYNGKSTVQLIIKDFR